MAAVRRDRPLKIPKEGKLDATKRFRIWAQGATDQVGHRNYLTQLLFWCARQSFIDKNRAAMVDFMEDTLRIRTDRKSVV